MTEQEEYRKRLGDYRASLQKRPSHMRAADVCIKRLDKGGTTLQCVRGEVFLHVWAPVMTEYVEWVLGEAVKAGKQRLYFLARDGYMMYLAAKELVKSRGLAMDVRYLKISRYAIRGAECYFSGREAPGHSREHYEAAVSYFRQEGMFQEIPYALVDSGWVGTLLLSLQRVLEHEKGEKVRLQGYYFGMYERPRGTGRGQYRAFYFGEREIRRKVRFSNCLFEAVFSAPEGMTRGYGVSGEAGGSVYVALESGRGNPNAEVMERFAGLLLEYLPYYMAEEKGGNLQGHGGKEFVECLLQPMMGNPTRWEAEAFGGLLFCDDVSESRLRPVAAKWEEGELRRRRFFIRVLNRILDKGLNRILDRLLIKVNLKPGVLHESAWPEGSIVRLGKQVGKHLRQERLYKTFRYLRKAIWK